MNIYEILKSFRAPLSEEQAWAVCYQCAGELISKREKSFENLQPQFIDVSLETTRIRKDGSIELTRVSSERPSQKTADVLFRLGSLIYECLDYGMEAFMERELDPSLERLILDMTCEQGDEGISVPEEFERKVVEGFKDGSLSRRERRLSHKGECTAKEINLEMVLQRCTDHLTEDISDPQGHFKAVCRALVNEALELSEFLRQLYNGSTLMSQSWGKGTGLTNWAYLQSLHASEWAKLWLQAMRELREGVTLRHVAHRTKLPASSFEMTPFEMLLDDIRYHRFQLNHVSVTTQRKKEDAHDIILDFIRSRPPLSKTSDRKMNPKPKGSPNLHEKLLNEIRKGKQLRRTPEPTLKTVREIYFEQISPSPEGSPYVTPKRKCLKPEIQLAESISRWDSPSPDSEHSPIEYELDSPKINLFEVDPSSPFESSDYGSGGSFKATCYELQKKRNYSSSSVSSVEEDCVQNVCFRTSFDTLPYDDRPLFPPSLRSLQNLKVTSKIYMTLKELKHMRKTLAKLELEALSPDDPLFKDLRSGKLCFCCQKRKFSLFGNWSRGCEICESKVCIYCIHKLEPSMSYVFLENSDIDRRDSGFCDAYWPFTPNIPTTQSSPSLGAALTETKLRTHKVCSSCKRFISMYC